MNPFICPLEKAKVLGQKTNKWLLGTLGLGWGDTDNSTVGAGWLEHPIMPERKEIKIKMES